MKYRRIVFSLFLFFAVVVGVTVGCFFWGYQAYRVGTPWDDGSTVVDGTIVPGLYEKQYRARREQNPDQVDQYLWFDTLSFIGLIVPTEQGERDGSLYVRGLDAAGEFDPYCEGGYLVEKPYLVIEKGGQPFSWEELKPGDIVRVVYLGGVKPLSGVTTYEPIYMEVLN